MYDYGSSFVLEKKLRLVCMTDHVNRVYQDGSFVIFSIPCSVEPVIEPHSHLCLSVESFCERGDLLRYTGTAAVSRVLVGSSSFASNARLSR